MPLVGYLMAYCKNTLLSRGQDSAALFRAIALNRLPSCKFAAAVSIRTLPSA
jgi:hypothetical protein